MILNEVFYSVQGEGLHAGCPAIFVRLGNCNLNCVWCDTRRARKNNKEISVAKLAAAVRKYSKCRHLVITGGEPMLQQKAISEIRKKFPDYHIEIETNGSRPVRCFDDVDLFTVSYKTKNSGNAPYSLKTKNKKCVYKFVVKTPRDFAEIEKIIKKYNLPSNKIFLMPEGATARQLMEKQGFIIEYCKKRGYKFSSRLHILANIK